MCRLLFQQGRPPPYAERGPRRFPIASTSEGLGFGPMPCTAKTIEVCFASWLHWRVGGVLIVEMGQAALRRLDLITQTGGGLAGWRAGAETGRDRQGQAGTSKARRRAGWPLDKGRGRRRHCWLRIKAGVATRGYRIPTNALSSRSDGRHSPCLIARLTAAT